MFTLSDDSHCASHVATNYEPAVEYLEILGVKETYVLERLDNTLDYQLIFDLVAKHMGLSAIKLVLSLHEVFLALITARLFYS